MIGSAVRGMWLAPNLVDIDTAVSCVFGIFPSATVKSVMGICCSVCVVTNP